MVAQRPQLATLGACGRTCGLQRGVEVEGLRAVALLAVIQALEQRRDLVFSEAGERQVDRRLQLGEQTREEFLVERAGDLVQRDVEEARLVGRNVEEDHGDRPHAEPARGNQALVAADDDAVLAASEDRVDQPKFLDGPRQRLQLDVGHAPGIRRVRPQRVDVDVFDGHRRRPCRKQRRPLTHAAASNGDEQRGHDRL